MLSLRMYSQQASKEINMNIERALRGIAGAFVLATVVLGVFHHSYWLGFTAFVGLNLFQSCFTNWCPMIWVLEKAGMKRCA
jgi:hypothetical protein